ncbi:hypothetical protein C0Q70_16288 [Pomacea canaliculata]|uniref:Uncharacterized protein n=1 Tax=Pomacea canaliculata TaxID=400727 RepID=A0A2T7NPD0_POMCA|nr:hypothetical protein C0Q70_16288 [Pomacea canaliculata]
MCAPSSLYQHRHTSLENRSRLPQHPLLLTAASLICNYSGEEFPDILPTCLPLARPQQAVPDSGSEAPAANLSFHEERKKASAPLARAMKGFTSPALAFPFGERENGERKGERESGENISSQLHATKRTSSLAPSPQRIHRTPNSCRIVWQSAYVTDAALGREGEGGREIEIAQLDSCRSGKTPKGHTV